MTQWPARQLLTTGASRRFRNAIVFYWCGAEGCDNVWQEQTHPASMRWEEKRSPIRTPLVKDNANPGDPFLRLPARQGSVRVRSRGRRMLGSWRYRICARNHREQDCRADHGAVLHKARISKYRLKACRDRTTETCQRAEGHRPGRVITACQASPR